MPDASSSRAQRTRQSQQLAQLNRNLITEASKGGRLSLALFFYGISVTALLTLCGMIVSSILPKWFIFTLLAASTASLLCGLFEHDVLSSKTKFRSVVVASIVIAVHCVVGIAVWPGVLSIAPSFATIPGTPNARLTLEMKNNTTHSLYSPGMGFYVEGSRSSIDDFAFVIPRETRSEMDPTLPAFVDS